MKYKIAYESYWYDKQERWLVFVWRNETHLNLYSGQRVRVYDITTVDEYTKRGYLEQFGGPITLSKETICILRWIRKNWNKIQDFAKEEQLKHQL